MKPYFIFNNIDSTEYLTISKLPSIIRASRDIEKIEIPGRSGFITQDLGTYRSTLKSCECWIKNLEDIDFICSWLIGSGNLVFSNESDKFYKATIINQIEFIKIAKEFRSFIVIFETQPFKYGLNNDLITITSPSSIYNPTTSSSDPIIKVYGTGDIVLNINEQQFGLYDLDQYITIDSGMMDCYKDTEPRNSATQGEFPQIELGLNNIDWMGNVSSVQITPNWRWL